VVAIVCLNADINMSGLGVNHSGAVGDCAIAGGCAGGDSDCDGDVLWLCWCRGGETVAWVSCLVIMFYVSGARLVVLVSCSCATGGCAIAGDYASGKGDSAGRRVWLWRCWGG